MFPAFLAHSIPVCSLRKQRHKLPNKCSLIHNTYTLSSNRDQANRFNFNFSSLRYLDSCISLYNEIPGVGVFCFLFLPGRVHNFNCFNFPAQSCLLFTHPKLIAVFYYSMTDDCIVVSTKIAFAIRCLISVLIQFVLIVLYADINKNFSLHLSFAQPYLCGRVFFSSLLLHVLKSLYATLISYLLSFYLDLDAFYFNTHILG